ncbi:MAG: sigma-54-dependent Fis family transcriptional regulator [Candidatus Krumholzibacteriota bacterium]|nr:sigma-54-dependent Fis family transcriptional regulator [Candidatus Krumholzibacteriota bacterium]
MSRILIIDDEIKITMLLSERIASEGFDVETFTGAEEALIRITEGKADIVLCDLRLGGMDGLELLRQTKVRSPGTDFVMMTAYASASTAVEAMREGAYEYLVKPFQMDEVILLLKRIQERRDLVVENLALREKVSTTGSETRLIGASPVINDVRDVILKVAPTDTPVLIFGESGTGKELVAAEIHKASRRSSNPYIILNCAAIPDTLIEGELFGFEKGAFTGASQKKPGQFKLADKGTIFLDEIGELPVALQAKVLRAIELGEFLPLGSSRPVRVDVRVIAATNRDLEKMSAEGSFRSDLYYRLNVFPVRIPPLRDRPEDILPIAEDFIRGRAEHLTPLGKDVIEKLSGYAWPGNVRELRNILERATILAGSGPITTAHLSLGAGQALSSPEDALGSLIGKKSLPEIEQSLIELAIKRSGGNKSKAASILGITRRTLYGRLEKYGLASGPAEEDE